MKPSASSPNDTSFLADYDPNAYERPSVAVDVALITILDNELLVLMIKRDQRPQRNRLQLPGGFVKMDESLDDTAKRVLAEKAGVTNVFTEQLYTFGAPGRDPRTRVISVAYYALVHHESLSLSEHTQLVSVEGLPETAQVAFDHAEIVTATVERLRGKLQYAPVGYELLDDEFTLYDIQQVYEAILDKPLSKPPFRKMILGRDEIEPSGKERSHIGRPAALYRRKKFAPRE